MKTKVVIEIETNIEGAIGYDVDSDDPIDITDELERDLHDAIEKAIKTTIDMNDDEFTDCIYDNELETHPDKIKWEDYGLKININTEAPTKKQD